jgi:hypothetical protein
MRPSENPSDQDTGTMSRAKHDYSVPVSAAKVCHTGGTVRRAAPHELEGGRCQWVFDDDETLHKTGRYSRRCKGRPYWICGGRRFPRLYCWVHGSIIVRNGRRYNKKETPGGKKPQAQGRCRSVG